MRAECSRLWRGRPGATDGGGGQDGFTLVEVLISLSILSILFFVVVGGMSLLALSSGLNRGEGAVGSVVRRAAEAVRGDAYIPCNPGDSAYSFSPMPTQANLLPENQGAPRVQLPFVVNIKTFDGATTLWTPATGWQNCAGNTTAIQTVLIEDDTNSGGIKQTESVVRAVQP